MTKSSFKWTYERAHAVQSVRWALISTLVLRLHKGAFWEIHMNDSVTGMGAITLQKSLPTWYTSRNFVSKPLINIFWAEITIKVK